MAAHTPDEALRILAKILITMTYPTAATEVIWLQSKTYIVAIDPGLARGLSGMGMSKKDVKQWLFENARVAYEDLQPEEAQRLQDAVEAGHIPPRILSKEHLKRGGRIPIVSGPDHIHIVVVGGTPGYAGVWCYPGPKSGHQTKPIRGATLTQSGR